MARADLGTPSAVQKTATSDSNRIVRFGSEATNGERPSVCTEEVVSSLSRLWKHWAGRSLTAFGGVIGNDLDSDFDTVAVQRLHYVPKFIHTPQRVLARALCL